jgi:hypothetical protein
MDARRAVPGRPLGPQPGASAAGHDGAQRSRLDPLRLDSATHHRCKAARIPDRFARGDVVAAVGGGAGDGPAADLDRAADCSTTIELGSDCVVGRWRGGNVLAYVQRH